MTRLDAHPLVFAATEAAASGTQVALIAWETADGAVHWRTVPGPCSDVVLAGMLARLGEPDQVAEVEGDD
ncbi:hypothetical protein [Falsiroseomonas tokyonensis]|uniref:Uncharacterized protein n=1 Tax=Falsiroseomonas tokyonensis TaxID=430521 RepID=A0ABV7C2C7_9PROT|nr:hypothetical protein [Falsiroseomonas tokyonensis]MBU8540797.1 hypothetical protein [Falsiroseomonas tokyonensis]